MKRIRRIFEKAGELLVDWLRLDQPGRGRKGLWQDLEALNTEGKASVRSYCIRKSANVFMTVAAGLLLSAISLFACTGGSNRIENRRLARPGYGEGDRRELLSVQADGEEVQEIAVTVQERQYTDREKQELTDQAIDKLETLLPGSNVSLDEVRSNLVFPESMENGAVKISWMTIPYGVIDEDGTLLGSEDENGVLVEIQGTLTCGGKETLYTTYANVFPQELSEEEQLHRDIQREVEKADARERHDSMLELPDEVDGKLLVWMRPRDNPFLSLLLLTALAAACVWVQMDNQVHKRAELRKTQLALDYPDLLWKMTMLLGAGLGIKGTFVRISEQYQREKTAGTERYVYEEITYACHEMRSGVSEAEAYERFGKRCQLPEYIRLGSVLSQNLKKGARGLTGLLETEAAAALTERKNQARRLGEQAGTKLLLPMILMLGVVLVILVVPAFLSF